MRSVVSLNDFAYHIALIAIVYVIGFGTIRCMRYVLIDPDASEPDVKSKVN